MNAKIEALRTEIEKCRAAYAAIVDTGTRLEIQAANKATKAAQAALVDALIEGAEPCPTSGLTPTGLIQYDDKIGELVEIGSRVVPHYRALGDDQESAVRNWNEGVAELRKRRDALPEADRKKPLVVLGEDGKLVGLPLAWYAPKARRPARRPVKP